MASKKKEGSGLNIPDAPFRPGEEAVFETWSWKPSDLNRPDPTKCTSEDTVPHAQGLVRVLGDDDKASGASNPKLSADQ